jgi:hypothetical protein
LATPKDSPRFALTVGGLFELARLSARGAVWARAVDLASANATAGRTRGCLQAGGATRRERNATGWLRWRA